MNTTKNSNIRWLMLAVGVFTMLFAGMIYAWSILKAPFAEELGFGVNDLSFNYTLTISFFCLGGLITSKIEKLVGIRLTIAIAAILAGAGIALSGIVVESNIITLYLTYALLGGLGIGIAYIAIISTVNAWFPDKKGLSSGALMMGFGLSSLILGKLASKLYATESFGWHKTLVLIGICLAVVVFASAFVLKKPTAEYVLPEAQKKAKAFSEDFEEKDYTALEMIKRFSFWRALLFLICITAVGSSVISFARDLAISVGAGVELATTLVGVLAVCNGLGRIITGAVFDYMGRRFTMIAANVLTILSAAVTLLAVSIGSLGLCIVGLCLTGISYGSSPTIASAFVSAFYGRKNFASNLGVINLNLMCASFVATACSSLQTATSGYAVPFVLLLSLSGVALVLNLTIKRP